MREQIEFLERPPEPVWEAMCQWLKHHGVTGASMPSWSLWFDRCEHTRRIRYPEVIFGVDPAARPLPEGMQTTVAGDIVTGTVVRTVQLEAVPSPFPQELRLHRLRCNYTCVNNPALAEVLTVPPTWPATPRVLGSLCGPG